MTKDKQLKRGIETLRVAANTIDVTTVNAMPTSGFRWLCRNVTSHATFSVAEDLTDAFKDLIDGARTGAKDLEFRRGPVLYHLDRFEALFCPESGAAFPLR